MDKVVLGLEDLEDRVVKLEARFAALKKLVDSEEVVVYKAPRLHLFYTGKRPDTADD